MNLEETHLPGVLSIIPTRYVDSRGFFSESWNRQRLFEHGLAVEFLQDNHSLSATTGTVRGMHFQAPPRAQGKLVRCGRGAIFDVVVDIRKGSPTYGQWIGEDLSFDNGKQLWIPPGFLHGFVTREPNSEIIYKCTDYYAPDCDRVVRWDSCGIDWRLTGEPILSTKDKAAPTLAEFDSPFIYETSSA